MRKTPQSDGTALMFMYRLTVGVIANVAIALLASMPIGLLAVRILFEERFLRRELQGYEAYTGRVRYRLIPLLW